MPDWYRPNVPIDDGRNDAERDKILDTIIARIKALEDRPAGANGTDGINGTDGANGDNGAIGDAGPPGAGITEVEVYTVVTDDDPQAKLIPTQDGLKLVLGIPQGEQGVDGDQANVEDLRAAAEALIALLTAPLVARIEELESRPESFTTVLQTEDGTVVKEREVNLGGRLYLRFYPGGFTRRIPLHAPEG